MNYSGGMPEWHQYNTSQTNEAIPPTQNVNSGHLAFIPGVGPSMNAINLNSESLNKHQNDTNFNPRNYQSYNNVSNGPNIPNNSPLSSMVQMQNCIGHYGTPNTRNPMLDNMNTSVDPRNTTIGTINDESGYRSNQVPFHGAIGHLNGPSCNLNASSGSGSGSGARINSGSGIGTNPSNGTGPMFGPNARHGHVTGHGSNPGPGNVGSRNTNIGSVASSGKPGPPSSFMPCKAACCNSDPNINQQWEKFGSYQNSATYRDNVHPSGYQMDNRHFGNNCNFRKDNLEGKEVMGPTLPNTSAIDHRRNFMDYKYHKDHLVHRNYSTNSGMFHNYPMQNYNYSTEHQKYAYSMKEHAKTNNMNIPNSTMLKHQEQNFIAQQKFNNKQFQYQNGNMLPKVSTLNANMAASSQNYFNSQFPRNVSTEMSHESQETTDNTAMVNRMQSNFMHGSSPQHQMFQHKIAMQKFSMENQLREFSRMPGHHLHQKYKECLPRCREIVKLQQSSYQNPVQEATRVPTPVNATVPPINLQFDQNGMLVNSSYVPDGFSKLQHVSVVERAAESVEKQNEDQTVSMVNERCQQSQQQEQLMISQQNEHVPSSCAKTGQKQNRYLMHKDFNQNQLKVQTSKSHNFGSLSGNSSSETTIGQKVSKEFANKPNLDVRQFLANWDETDDEEGTTNLPDTVLSETTPVVVVSYENINIASKTPQDAEAPRKSNFCSSEILESAKEDEADVIAAQGLTISYSSSDNIELAKMSKRTIGEGVVKPGSIIHCISNGPDEIPTIHIVDNLEISNILGASNDQVIQTLEKQKTLSFFRESSNNETEAMVLESSEQQDKSDTNVLPANYGEPLDDVNKEEPNISETIQTNDQELRTLSTSSKNNLDASVTMELKKQHSFEESHNPDDISLPDLPTSECTPISTTLNTPTHSDAEESQNMEDLSISMNPIEVMQNSPVISFTQLNSEEKVKNRTLDSLGLEFQKESRYKNSESNVSHEQEVTLSNFDFSNNSKAKPGETIKNKHVKILGTNVARKKVFLIDAKESDSRISNTPGILTSMEYELEVQQESADDEKSSNRELSDGKHEERHKNVKRSREAVGHTTQSSDSIENLSSIESGDESASKIERNPFKKKRIKTSTGSINISCLAETEASVRKTYEDKHLDKRRNSDHSRRKSFDAKKLDNSSLQQSEEHSVCHMTCKYKQYSVAVIKDNVTLSDKKSYGTTDRTMNEKSIEFPSKTINTKEQIEPTETRKHASSKAISVLQETSKLLQKDLKTVDGDVRYTAEEMRLLKEYGKKKDKLHQTHDTHSDSSRDEKIKCRNHSYKTLQQNADEDSQKITKNSFYHRNKLECSQIKQHSEVPGFHRACSEENSVSSAVNLSFQNSETQEEARSQFRPKSLVQNADFGIQVANVNLKIKDNDVGKELILESKSQEHTKDSLDTIKIEINVSCTDRNLKGQEQNKRLLYDDRNLFEIDYSPSCTNTLDCQRRLHTRTHEEQAHRASVTETNQINDEIDLNSSNTLGKDRRASLETNEEIGSIVPKEQCGLVLDNQSFKSSKDTSRTEAIEVNNFTDLNKSKSAISNTAIVDASINEIKGKLEREKEDDFTSVDDNRTDILIEKDSSKKLPENSLAEPSAKSLHNLDTKLDLNFCKLEHKNSHSNCLDEELIEEEYKSKWKKPKRDNFEDCDVFQSSSGYVNPLFSGIDKPKSPDPVYTTKDGKISYSPKTPKRKSSRKCSKSCKRKRYHLSDRRKHEYKNTKYIYDRKGNYFDEFCSKSYKYKDCVHSIRNNNAVWSDHYKIDEMYSSSDSEEIIERGKHRVAETSSYLTEWHENEAALLESDYENKNKDNTADDVSNKDKDTNQEEIPSINKEHEDCKSDDKDAPLDTSLQSKNEEKSIESNVDQIESLILDNLSENHENENRSLNSDCTDTITDKIDSKIISENEKNIRSENESSISKLLNEDENKQESTLCNCEEKKNDTEIVSGEKDNNEQKEEISIISDGQNSFLEAENNSENVEHTETTNENLESNENNKPVTETEMTKEILEPRVNFENSVEPVSQEFLKPEICDNTSTVIVKYDESNIINSEENVSEYTEEIIQFNEEIEIPNDDKTQEESTNNDAEENIQVLEYQNDDDSSKHIPTLNQKESESQMTQINVTVDQQNDSKHNSIETIKSEINMSTNSVQLNNDDIIEEQNFTGFAKYEIPTEAVIMFDKNEVEVVSLSIEEIPEESDIADSLKDKNNVDDPPKLSEHERNLSRKNSEEELSVLSKYCSIENFSHVDSESSRNKAEDGKQNSLEIPCKSSNHSSENNTDVKTLPKLVIKKTDASNPTPECSMDYTDSSEKCDEKLLSEMRPKIPKMIIMKNRSRSVTPVVEILEKNKSDIVRSTLERNDEESSDSKSSTLKHCSYENKVPKVKIKLEEISSKDLKLYLKRKASKNIIPKLKIKKMKTQEKMESESSSGTDNSEDEGKNIRDSMNNNAETERLPKLKYRKQEENKSLLSEQNKGKDFSILKMSSKKSNRKKEEDSNHTAKYNNTKTIDDKLKKKFSQCIIEKIPKVIIKRTQIGTKFKCEISKSKKTSVAETSKWQPKVKLQRLEALDYMVKNSKHSKMTFKGKLDALESKSDINDKKDQIYDSKSKLCRSNSASNLSPVKCKHRRLSDSDYVKMSLQSANKVSDYVDDKITNFELDNNGTDFKRKGKKIKSFTGNRQDRENDENEDETEAKHSFKDILMNENKDLRVHKEYSSFGTKESVPFIENKFLNSSRFDDEERSIIEIDSSDESETTIEILPASPDSSEDEGKDAEFDDASRINEDDAIPTQLELEMELIDKNNMDSETAPKMNRASHSKSKKESHKTYFNEFPRSSKNTSDQKATDSRNYFYCNDLLVKEVLAAKETLKKCLTLPENEDILQKGLKSKTLSEKKQVLGFNFTDLRRSLSKSHSNSVNKSRNSDKKCESPSNLNTEEQRCSKQERIYTTECSIASTCGDSNVPESTTISLKTLKQFSRIITNANGSRESHEKKSEKKVNSNLEDQKDNDSSSEAKTKEDNMPLLMPEFALNFDSSLDRDSSRSPPVITNQEESEQAIEDTKLMEGKAINQNGEVGEDKKHSYKDREMTIADIITQLAYHEKATIRHERYCNLCERWFPTTSRHRRHLVGYQHRYMELTQRKSIHALFILFTGKPCPRLLPPNIIRNDCSIGEMTPLQIAVQDVAICDTQQDQKTKE